MACGLCPGYFSVWYYGTSPNSPSTGNVWNQIENVDSWTIDANVQEATKKRTSSTNGLAVKFCEDVVDFTASVTVTLCKSDWLYCHLLEDGYTIANTRETWWFFGWSSGTSLGQGVSPQGPTVWDNAAILDWETWRNSGLWDGAAGTPSHTDAGVFFFGKVVPPGFGGDNTATDPSTATFSINISAGPVLPTPSVSCGVN